MTHETPSASRGSYFGNKNIAAVAYIEASQLDASVWCLKRSEMRNAQYKVI